MINITSRRYLSMVFKQITNSFFQLHRLSLVTLFLPLFITACSTTHPSGQTKPTSAQIPQAKPMRIIKQPKSVVVKKKPTNSFGYRLSAAAKERTKHHVVYDGRYIRIGYPWGDVPQNIGVCTDVVIRSYRRLGIDLQQQVHKDMVNNFNAYPNLSKWQLNGPDTNIDHRRVYNLRAFLNRHAVRLPVSHNPQHYKPGDLVTWELAPGQGHIGIVINERSKQDPRRYLVVHNIGEGPKKEDVLFRFPINGHYRYNGKMRYYRPTYYARAGNAQKQPVSLPGIGRIPPELLR